VRVLSLSVAILVVAVLTASSVCVARCVGAPCHGGVEHAGTTKVPPCHKEKPPNSPIEPCKVSVLIATADTPALTKAAIVKGASFVIWTEFASLRFPEIGAPAHPETSSPPGSPELRFSVILRI
jgi:hypothetical protein